MRARSLALVVVFAAAPACAGADGLGPALTADQFDALTRGKTITYSAEGEVYGVEEYRPGHKVVWAFAEGDCQEGDWFAQGDQICFDYHHAEIGLQCWTFHQGAEGLVAWFEGRQDGEPLVSLRESTVPLNCPGPELGV